MVVWVRSDRCLRVIQLNTHQGCAAEWTRKAELRKPQFGLLPTNARKKYIIWAYCTLQSNYYLSQLGIESHKLPINIMRVPGLGLVSLLQALAHISPVLCHVLTHHKTCKSTPNDPSWPSISQWAHLNESLSGRLLHPSPPALACHVSYPGSNDTCSDIMSSWSTFAFHQDNPISTAWNNMNDDSCLPTTSSPCTGLGYPVYVVNATSANHVKLAIHFARKNNIRLNVKASGHDYLKR